ncbi:uncharacterized protein [Montipora capricornis]|uniref:uncharacterized protein isoform X1 n=1 Tax=Montipora capricornis TaxID=246305 RepID=UPI0035F14429
MFKKRNAGDQLLLAVKLNKVSEISRLVALGVNVNSRIDKNGKTALHYAAYKGQFSSVKALVEAGADLDVTDENGVTPLHRAVIEGHSDIVRILLEALCSTDKKDENGNTALHEAAWNGYSKCVELLVKARCNVNLHNRTGYTSLHLAAQNCHCNTVEALLRGGANPLAKNNYGDSSLHVAVRYGHVDVCKILLAKCQDNVSEQNNDGNTALHIATRMGHEKLVDMLVEARSIITTKNNVGDTARDIAIQNGFKKIAKQLVPANCNGSWKMFKRGRKGRPCSCDLSSMPVESICSTQATTATPLWVPKPQPQDNLSPKVPAFPPKKSSQSQDDSSHFSGSEGKKDKGKWKYKILKIKPNEMCSIEREYIAFLRKRKVRKYPRSRSRSTNKSQEERRLSDPGLHLESKNSLSHIKGKNKKSAQSRDDLAISFTPKKTKKDKGLFNLFRSTSDQDLTAEMKNGTLLGKKHKDKLPPSKELMGNGFHHSVPVEGVKEKAETEETKEKRKERGEKGEDKAGKKEKISKKDREEDKERKEKREKRKEKEKEKDRKLKRRDEMEGSEADCSICQERLRKSREKSHKESRHRDKEHRSKHEHKRSRDYEEEDVKDRGHKYLDKNDDEKEYRKKKHHHEREKEREKSRKEKRHHHERHHHKRRTEDHCPGNEVDCGPFPCNEANCMTCKESLNRFEAWQERCTIEIESTRRRLEHRLHRLEKKLEEQQSEEKQIKDREYDRVLGRVTDECREVSKSVRDSSGDVKEEIRGLIRGGLSKLELKLGQISTGYNIPFMEFQDRCNPEFGRNCSADRGIRRAMRSRSSPHLGRAPCEDCASALEHNGLMPPVPTTPLNVSTSLTSGTSSAVSSRANISDTGSMEMVIAARPVLEEEVLRVVPETILEAKPVVEECVLNLCDTYAASQVQHQRQIQEVEKWWRHKAEEEQRVLYARICELEQMLVSTRIGDGSNDDSITAYIV